MPRSDRAHTSRAREALEPRPLAVRRRRHHLPAPLTSFIGRESELAQLLAVLRENRLVTLVGAPGVGKTRLALRIAEEAQDQFPDGVWLVELAALAEPALVPSLVVAGLGLREEGSRSPVDLLAEWLRPLRALLVLDNCEHLLDACAVLVDALLAAAPRLRVLATSRAPLGLIGEVGWRVPSLTLPEADGTDLGGPARSPEPANEDAIQAVVGSEAGRLFSDRARAVWTGFQVTAENAAAVAQICRRLDGIPLALELAAARLRALAPGQIAARLGDRFALLTGGSRVESRRHRTLRALVDWSHDLLSAPEQVLLRRLSVFAGGWTLDAAEAVCGGVPSRRSRITSEDSDSRLVTCDSRLDVLDSLSRLVDTSLVLADEQDGETRYRLLETVRQYGAEKQCEAGEEVALHDRHRDWFLSLAEQADPELIGPRQIGWLNRLEREHGNLSAALAWAREAAGADRSVAACLGLRLAGALHWFWWLGGHVGEGRGWLDDTLGGATDQQQHRKVRARALYAAGVLALIQGDYGEARALLQEGAEIYEHQGDASGLGRALTYLGLARWLLGDRDGVRALYDRSMVLSRDAGDIWGLALAGSQAASAARQDGDLGAAAAFLEECVPLARTTGDRYLIGTTLPKWGYLSLQLGEYDRAATLFKEALTLLRELREGWWTARCFKFLALVACARRDYHRATVLLGAVQTGLEAVGARLIPAEQADRDRAEATVRAALGEQAFAAAWAEGRGMHVDLAIDFALEVASRTSPVEGGSLVTGDVRPGTRDSEALTPRERDVVALIARGLTNHQIADELVVSERTVEWHVANVLGKLSLDSRAQVAVWAFEMGLCEPRTA